MSIKPSKASGVLRGQQSILYAILILAGQGLYPHGSAYLIALRRPRHWFVPLFAIHCCPLALCKCWNNQMLPGNKISHGTYYACVIYSAYARDAFTHRTHVFWAILFSKIIYRRVTFLNVDGCLSSKHPQNTCYGAYSCVHSTLPVGETCICIPFLGKLWWVSVPFDRRYLSVIFHLWSQLHDLFCLVPTELEWG